MKAVCLWSAGKDSCFAYYKAKQQGHNIISLFNFTEFDGANSLSHGLSAGIIHRQITATGLSFLQKPMPKENYRNEFIALIKQWKKENGIEGIVFGDIYLEEHKEWIEMACKESGVAPIFPLWGKDTAILINEIIGAGFKAIIVSVLKDSLGNEWLGRKIDNDFVKEIDGLGNIDPCGEKGEFHTFVYDGPIFKKPVEFSIGEKISKDKHWFLELV
jgi:uncharacterized protein (TIGR00290 family)